MSDQTAAQRSKMADAFALVDNVLVAANEFANDPFWGDLEDILAYGGGVVRREDEMREERRRGRRRWQHTGVLVWRVLSLQITPLKTLYETLL